jgi:hypothetical protein
VFNVNEVERESCKGFVKPRGNWSDRKLARFPIPERARHVITKIGLHERGSRNKRGIDNHGENPQSTRQYSSVPETPAR